MDNPYKQKLISEKYIVNRIAKGGCYCVRRYILQDIDHSKLPKTKKSELWDLVNNKTDWGSC